MIQFRLVPEDDGYRAEILDDACAIFGDWVNHDLLGEVGVKEQLEIARAVAAGREPQVGAARVDGGPGYDCMHNAYEITITRERVSLRLQEDLGDEAGSCGKAEYIAFLEAILDRLDGLAQE